MTDGLAATLTRKFIIVGASYRSRSFSQRVASKHAMVKPQSCPWHEHALIRKAHEKAYAKEHP